MNQAPPHLMTEAETARYLSLSRGYLRRMRMHGGACGTPGPPYCKIGGAIRYDAQDLEQWLESRKVRPVPVQMIGG